MKPYLVILPRYACGFFSHFFQVLAMLEYAEEHRLIPVVFFNRDFAFWREQPFNGTRNAWEYYFEPVSECRLDELTGRSEDELFGMSTQQLLELEYAHIQFSDTYRDSLGVCGLISHRQRMKAARLIQNYIRIRTPLLDRAEAFMKIHFTSDIVGLHYRGSDKKEDWPVSGRVDFSQYEAELLNFAGQKLFAATDCQHASERLQRRYNSVSTVSNRTQSAVPVHRQNSRQGKPQLGEEVLLDCILLSRCSHLIHGLSNVSAAALALNPELRNTDLYM